MKRCTAVEHKTISNLTIFDQELASAEIVIEFTDGTVFSAALESRSSVDAKLTRDDGGEPQILAQF